MMVLTPAPTIETIAIATIKKGNAVKARDYPLLEAGVFTVAVMVVLVNLIVDLLYQFVDPRLRAKVN